MSRKSTEMWLKIGAELVMVFGVLIAAAAIPALAAPTRFLTDLIFFPMDGAQTIGAPETRLIMAIGGGVMLGWGVTLWLLVTRLYPREPELARQIILTGVIAWFVVDSAGSILAGAPLNAAFNVLFLLIFLVPLWRSSPGAVRHA